MVEEKLNFSKANRFIPFIILLGIGIGLAAYFMGTDKSILQTIVSHVITSLVIGYSLLVVIFSKGYLLKFFSYEWQKIIGLLLIFFVIGVIASEIEQFINGELFSSEGYSAFTGGKLYLINGILSAVIGLGNYLTINLFETKHTDSDITTEGIIEAEPIFQIPSKQGENIVLIPVTKVLYFEAYDNYSFVIDEEGEKKLCDFSLLFLESRLGKNFIRIHRKYIVNKNNIAAVRPHLNKRYIIELKDGSSITSSKSYAGIIKDLIRLN